MKPHARLGSFVCTLLLVGMLGPGHARDHGPIAGDDVVGKPLGRDWVAMPPERLDQLRGGMMMPSGLMMSFGIERAVYIDGQLVATTRLSVPDISRITADQATALAAAQDTMLVQVGEGNTFVPNGMGGIVIQNTRNDTDIRAMTTISVVSGALGMFQDLNANAALQTALLSAPGGP